MRKYKQILEAINRGIQFALDDFKPENVIETKAKDKIIDKDDSLYNSVTLKTNFVDLDLPSGNLWAKYNFGVNPDKLKEYNDWFGNYYSWGELTPKDDYRQNNYKFSRESISAGRYYYYYTKYCNDKDDGLNGYTDNYTNLLPEDDVIHVNMGKKYYMPTNDDISELIEYTNQEYVKNYLGVSSLNGVIFSSKTDNTKNIFIPCAGIRHAKQNFNPNGYSGVGFEIHVWSATYAYDFTSRRACTLDVLEYQTNEKYNRYKILDHEDDKFCKISKNEHRFEGCPVRAIWKNR